MSKKFCVLTYGRSGSTSFMSALEKFPDIAVPNKNIRCFDNELLHPNYVEEYLVEYSKLCGKEIGSASQLIENFFLFNAGVAWAGFKTMPRRHPDFRSFMRRKDIQFIILTRESIPSMIASLFLAQSVGCWRRSGEPQPQLWRFNPSTDGPSVLGLVSRTRRHNILFDRIQNALRIKYEDLCNENFNSSDVNDFFERRIGLENVRPPVCGSQYVLNWPEFVEFVDNAYESNLTILDRNAGSKARPLVHVDRHQLSETRDISE